MVNVAAVTVTTSTISPQYPLTSSPHSYYCQTIIVATLSPLPYSHCCPDHSFDVLAATFTISQPPCSYRYRHTANAAPLLSQPHHRSIYSHTATATIQPSLSPYLHSHTVTVATALLLPLTQPHVTTATLSSPHRVITANYCHCITDTIATLW